MPQVITYTGKQMTPEYPSGIVTALKGLLISGSAAAGILQF